MIDWLLKKKTTTGNVDFDRYLQQTFKVPRDLPIENMEFVVLDCEMTGLEKNAELVSFGAVRVSNNRIYTYEAMDLKFSFENNNAAAEIHGQLVAKDGKVPGQVISEILNFIKNAVVVGHSISIDLEQINQLLRSANRHLKLKNKILDTSDLMKRVDPVRFERSVAGQNSLRLDALCTELGVPIESRHTALGDAYMTAQVFLKLLNRLKKRKVLTAGQLLR